MSATMGVPVHVGACTSYGKPKKIPFGRERNGTIEEVKMRDKQNLYLTSSYRTSSLYGITVKKNKIL